MAFDLDGLPQKMSRRELPQSYPQPGWVEHDAEQICRDVIEVTRDVVEAVEAEGSLVAAIGITNQRETTVVWERDTGRPISPAIVWQDRRTADICETLKKAGYEEHVRQRSGLLLDPYFSGTKLAWMLDAVAGAREAAEKGELAFGTIDTWLLWHLTGGKVHATDASNASRTMLYDIRAGCWSDDLMEVLRVPPALLPEVRDSAGDFGATDSAIFGRPIPITGIAGDQQASTFGQAAFRSGMMKCTYGTGAFALLNTGTERIESKNRLLTTVAWQLDGSLTYALEGSIFVAGASVQWLRDGLGIIKTAPETEALAAGIESTRGVYFVPAFVGLGAPHWDTNARGALFGMTRDTGPAEIARAALEAIAYQTRELLEAMEADGAKQPSKLKVDGGVTENGWAMQFLSDILSIDIERPVVTEMTALGVATLAGLGAGVYRDLEEITVTLRSDCVWSPSMTDGCRAELYSGWKTAVSRTLSK
jgi:glycerol kinase